MRLLITNSVPLNGGDEALLRATIAVLRDQFPNATVKVLCKDVSLCKKYFADIDLDTDLEYAGQPSNLTSRILRRIREVSYQLLGLPLYSRISTTLASRDERRVIDHYRDADLVISCPGGFLHDFYEIERRLRGFELALGLGRPVVIFGQSVGPFWKVQSKRRVSGVLSRLDAILLREQRSATHLADCNVDMSKVSVIGDIAFYWRRMAPQLFLAKNGPIRKVALSFRKWPLDGTSEAGIFEKATELCRELLESDSQIELLFLSTCQGISGYVDDSVVARSIVSALPEALSARCSVDARRYAPEELIRAYSKVDAYIGMRLHGAILAMLGGTPAMAIAYEEKTPGIYSALDLAQFQIDYRDTAAEWLACMRRFSRQIDQIRSRLPLVLNEAADLADSSKRVLSRVLQERTTA